jgi:hypothetical protein
VLDLHAAKFTPTRANDNACSNEPRPEFDVIIVRTNSILQLSCASKASLSLIRSMLEPPFN